MAIAMQESLPAQEISETEGQDAAIRDRFRNQVSGLQSTAGGQAIHAYASKANPAQGPSTEAIKKAVSVLLNPIGTAVSAYQRQEANDPTKYPEHAKRMAELDQKLKNLESQKKALGEGQSLKK